MCDLSWTSSAPGEQSGPKLSELNMRNVVSPMCGPERAGKADRKEG